MTYVITAPCIEIKDRSCIPVCPVDCIHPREEVDTGARMLYINPAECIDCDACLDACPVDAIVPDYDLTDANRVFLEINADYYALTPDAFAEKWSDV